MARNIKYKNIPKYYVFDSCKKLWIKRQRLQKHTAIGRLNVVSPKDSERFFLKLLLNRQKGVTSFEELRKYENVTYNTYKEAAIAMNLVKDDRQIYEIFDEACTIMLPNQLLKFFAWFLLSENIQGSKIWEKYKHFFIEGYLENKENNALNYLNNIFNLENRSCVDFGLNEPNRNLLNTSNIEEQNNMIFAKEKFNEMYTNLNSDQKSIFDKIVKNKSKIYFIDGPGGTGKTYLYNTIIYYFLSINKQVISMAWTGIASVLLPRGMTSHRTFKLPLDLDYIESAFLTSDEYKKKLREVDIIIWDEASMIPKKSIRNCR